MCPYLGIGSLQMPLVAVRPYQRKGGPWSPLTGVLIRRWHMKTETHREKVT